MNYRKTGLSKAVIILSTLGAEDSTLCSNVMKDVMVCLKDEEQKRLTDAFIALDCIPPDERATILRNFHDEIMQRQVELTQNEKREIIKCLPSTNGEIGIIDDGRFGFLKVLSADEIYQAIRHENPQLIALTLSLLTPEKSAEVLNKITQSNIRNDIARRIAEMSYIPDDTLNDVEETLKARLNINSGKFQAGKDGPTTLAQILARMEGAAETDILGDLVTKSPAKAKEVQNKLLVFEDIIHISDSDMRTKVLREIDYEKHLPKALKDASDKKLPDELLKKFERNMGSKMWERIIRYKIDLGPIPFSQVEEARRNIVDKIRALKDAGQLTIRRDFEEERIAE